MNFYFSVNNIANMLLEIKEKEASYTETWRLYKI